MSEREERSEEITACGLFDSHAHYFDARFEGTADALLREEIFGGGAEGVVNVATNGDNALRCIAQAAQYPKMYCAVGIHPEDGQNTEEPLSVCLDKIRILLDTAEKRKRNKIVALGEIGLDYHSENPNKLRQAELFEAQMAMAAEYSLPVVIHDREAHGDCMEMLRRHPQVTGILHSYSGSAEMAKQLTDRGWYLSFSGVLTFRNARKVREVAQAVPTDRILVETDAPYLSPEPFRGRLNHSGRMKYTVLQLAELLGLSYEETVRMTAENAKRIFGIS